MTPKTKNVFTVAAVIQLSIFMGFGPTSSFADSGHKAAEFLSHSGNIIYLALGVGLPLLRDGDNGKDNAARAADALGTSVLITEALKNIVREKRPDSNERDSFPSGHSTAAFAVAAMESSFHPKEAPLWYLGATAIAGSRLALHRHYWQDVIAGAAIGYGTARWEISQPHGLILTPLIGRDMMGIGFSKSL